MRRSGPEGPRVAPPRAARNATLARVMRSAAAEISYRFTSSMSVGRAERAARPCKTGPWLIARAPCPAHPWNRGGTAGRARRRRVTARPGRPPHAGEISGGGGRLRSAGAAARRGALPRRGTLARGRTPARRRGGRGPAVAGRQRRDQALRRLRAVRLVDPGLEDVERQRLAFGELHRDPA